MLRGMRTGITSTDNLEQSFSSICSGMIHLGEDEDRYRNSREYRGDTKAIGGTPKE